MLPALSVIVTVPTFVVALNAFWNVALEHPLLLSLQATFIVLSFFVHVVDAPVIVPHDGATLST